MVKRRLPRDLAEIFGYHQETSCKCHPDTKRTDSLDSPIHLPAPLGEIGNTFLGSGIDECLAHINRLLVAMCLMFQAWLSAEYFLYLVIR